MNLLYKAKIKIWYKPIIKFQKINWIKIIIKLNARKIFFCKEKTFELFRFIADVTYVCLFINLVDPKISRFFK